MKYSKWMIAAGAAVVLSVAAWIGITIAQDSPKGTAPLKEGSLQDDFTGYQEALWKKTDGYSNGSMFNCTWRADNIAFTDDGFLRLSLTSPSAGQYDGSEYRTTSKYGYGRYEVQMKPAAHPGIVSSFFTYTGPSEGEPWDEIDIEFLGKDTTKVQFNYFKGGVGGHEHVYDLGFDAAKEIHAYAFEWKKDSITWYVDDKPVYTAEENIPSVPGRIMMNLWNGTGVDDWLGPYDGQAPLYAYYDKIRFIPE